MHEPGRFPKIIQIQTTTACGARCVMCPHSQASKTWPNGPIDERLFRAIVDQCRRQPIKRICPYLMADPLCDARILERIAYIRSALPDVEIEISTTAQTLRPGRQRDLLSAPITELRISSHGITAEDYRLLMPGVKYESAWADLHSFVDKWRAKQPYDLRIVSLYGLLPPEREQAVAEYWHAQGIPLDRWRVTSRGARVDLNRFDAAHDPTDWPRARREPPFACRFARDTEWMHILSDGRVTLCCMDYYQEVIVGDLRHQSIEEVWTSPEFARARRKITGEIPTSDKFLCRRCEWYVSRSVLEARQVPPVVSDDREAVGCVI
jgi:MoaA/NifB/PqqE/SkfB family radical SAM enzyme